MTLDICWPIGLMFSLVGAMLAIFGAITRSNAMYQRSLGLNVNLWWGLFLLLFGGLMLLYAWRNSKKALTK